MIPVVHSHVLFSSLSALREGFKTGGEDIHVKYYPYERGGAGVDKVLPMLKGGHKTLWGRFYALA